MTTRASASTALLRATKKVAPLFPLESFVAVNPFVGLADQPFFDVAALVERTSGARMTMPRSFYVEAMKDGRLPRRCIVAALAELETVDGAVLDRTVRTLKGLLRDASLEDVALRRTRTIPTVADAAADVTGIDWPGIVTDRISAWAATHHDRGQAPWTSPFRDLSPWRAWREEAAMDRTPEVAGLPRFREIVAEMPADPLDAAARAIGRLGVPEDLLDDYLHRLLMTISGWAGYVRHRVWDAELRGEADDALVELLVIRLAWEVALLEGLDIERAFRRVPLARDPDLLVDLVLHAAYEKAQQDALLARFAGPSRSRSPRSARPSVQAVFCIDVRSEVIRRALESSDDAVETLGFAGFFGFPIELVPFGDERGHARCPVLLAPAHVVRETVSGVSADEEEALRSRRLDRRLAAQAWRSFKTSAVACFGFVSHVGLAYTWKLLTDSLGLTRPEPEPATDSLDAATARRLGPTVAPGTLCGRTTGMTAEQRLAAARAALSAMSLTEGFARLVVLVGHGASTVNNPHATSLDCGACGGHAGDANARVAALVLNDPDVRRGLAASGIVVPDDTVFLAALHDTTTDAITILNGDAVPASHGRDLERLASIFRRSARIARRERATRLDLDEGASLDEAVIARSRDGSEVRPEWGLAGCSAFVVAPRHLTKGIDLGGRAFLHSYDHRKDEDGKTLELVMTAPMVVASWISLQYFASTVDNRAFGSGNKTLHDVVGALGVLEGNGGDLRVGLPLQSVSDGTRWAHDPVRLSVVIAAPTAAIDAVISRHEPVRRLADNGWLHLFAMDDEGRVTDRYRGALAWEPVLGTVARAAA